MHGIIGGSTSAALAAWCTANGGEDATIFNPTHRLWFEWGSGLIRTDRTSTFKNLPGVSFRTGAVLETVQRFAKVARPDITKPTDEIIFVTTETVHTVFNDMMNDFKTRKPGKGVITVINNAPLEELDIQPYTDPMTGRQTRVIKRAKCGGVWYEGLTWHDATDELDLAALAGVMTRIGRESAASTGNLTSGVRPASATPARATKLGTGRRLKGVNPRSSKKPGDADHKLMAFNQRLIVSNAAGRILFKDLIVPNYDPSNYDMDYEIAKALNYGKQPGSINTNAAYPVGAIPQFDWNNGGLLKIGTNWVGQFLDWFKMTPYERIAYLGEYTAHKAGLLKAICSEQRWKDLPPLVEKDKDGNIINSWQIAEETAKWGLVPGVFVEPEWKPDVDVDKGVVWANKSSIYLCTKAGRTGTAASGGPTGKGLSILDGAPAVLAGPNGNDPSPVAEAGARWRFLRYYVAGMSPHMYVREGRRGVGEAEQQYDDTVEPERNVDEPVFAYGYPEVDGHWADCFASATGTIDFEGGSGLDGGQHPVATIMKWGSLKSNYADCCNLTWSRGASGTRQGWLSYRLELCYMLGGDVAGRAAAVAARRTAAAGRPIYVGDLTYQSDIYPEVAAAGHFLSVPGI